MGVPFFGGFSDGPESIRDMLDGAASRFGISGAEILESLLAMDMQDSARRLKELNIGHEDFRRQRLDVKQPSEADYDDFEVFDDDDAVQKEPRRKPVMAGEWYSLKDGALPGSNEDYDINVIGLRRDGLVQNVWFSYKNRKFYDRNGKTLDWMNWWTPVPPFPYEFKVEPTEKKK